MAVLITVAAVDTGVVTYTTALAHNWFGWNYDPTNHHGGGRSSGQGSSDSTPRGRAQVA